jgi:outer membrane receptor protein involved in Fe transport
MSRRTTRKSLALYSALAFTTSCAFAQQVAEPPAAEPKATTEINEEGDEMVVLSPFEVTTDKDKGYKATNATSGTRLNTAIKDVPISLEVITSEFMRDTGATNLREALRYSSGVVLDSQNDALVNMTEQDSIQSGSSGANDPRGSTRNQNNTTQKMRGFVVDKVLRGGFVKQSSTDWINIDRVEVVRGPSALLYGVGSFGGVINYQTKRPLLQEKAYAGVTVGSDDLLRGEFDYTAPIPGENPHKVAYRITGAAQINGDETEYYRNRQYFISPVVSFKPWENTNIIVDTEYGYQEQDGIGFQTIRSYSGSGSPAQMRAALMVTPTGQDPRTMRWSGPDTTRMSNAYSGTVDLEQKIGESFFLKAGVMLSHVDFDSKNINNTAIVGSGTDFSNKYNLDFYYDGSQTRVNGALVDLKNALFNATSNAEKDTLIANRVPGAFRGDRLYSAFTNQNVSDPLAEELGIPRPPKTDYQSMIRYSWSNSINEEDRTQFRVEANYKLDWLGKHSFLAGLQQQTLDRYDFVRSTRANLAGYTGDAYKVSSYKSLLDASPFRYGKQGDGLPDPEQVPISKQDRTNYDFGVYGVYQGQYWDERITVIGGARYDELDAENEVYSYGTLKTANYDLSNYVDEPPSEVSPQAGISFQVTRGLSVFGLYSTGLIPNYDQQDGNGELGMITADNKEVGIKFDIFDGRLSGTVSAYEITREGTPFFIWWAPAPYKAATSVYDESASMATVWQWMGPEGVWHAIRSTPNGLNVAKSIFPQGYWRTLENMAQVGPRGTSGQNQYLPDYNDPLWSTNPSSGGQNTSPANWWGITWTAKTQGAYIPTTTQNGQNLEVYFPLVNLSDPATLTFAKNAFNWAGSEFSGNTWPGQFYGPANDTPLAYGNGTWGKQNIPGWNGAAVPIDDRARGWDTQIIATPIDNLQFILSYAYVDREITSKYYKYAKDPYGFYFGMWNYPQYGWGTMNGSSPDSAYADPSDTSTSIVQIPIYAQSLDDTPEHQGSLWGKYSFTNDVVKGLEIGVGLQYFGERQWYSGFNTDGTAITLTDPNGKKVPVQYMTEPQQVWNLMIAYQRRLADKYQFRVALNVNNVLDDTDLYGLVFARGRKWSINSSLSF